MGLTIDPSPSFIVKALKRRPTPIPVDMLEDGEIAERDLSDEEAGDRDNDSADIIFVEKVG